MNKDKILTPRFNNLMTLGLGIPALMATGVIMFTTVFSDKVGFFGMVGIGVIY